MAASPTAKSVEYLRKQGYLVANVEKYNHITRRRNDLYGFIDILAIREGEVLAVQTTSASNISSRMNKITDHENVAAVRKAGIRIEVHGWKKVKNRWVVRVEDLS